MRKNFSVIFAPSPLHSCKFLLPTLWFMGLFFGIVFACCNDSFSSLMRVALLSEVSIVGLAAVLSLPYFLTAIAVFISRPGWILVIAFCKAFSFGACCFATELMFGHSGWLIRMFILFSDWTGIPVLYWLWVRCLGREQKRLTGTFIASLLLLMFCGSIDLWFIVPFLTTVR